MNIGDLVTDEWGALAIILQIGNIYTDSVIIQFIRTGKKHNTFKSCIKPLEEK